MQPKLNAQLKHFVFDHADHVIKALRGKDVAAVCEVEGHGGVSLLSGQVGYLYDDLDGGFAYDYNSHIDLSSTIAPSINLSSEMSKMSLSRANTSNPSWRTNFNQIVGNITKEKVKILQEADNIFIEELIKNNLYNKIWQAYAALLPVKTVGVMGDSRTYEYTCLLRAVVSEDGMTADYFNFPKDFLDKISNKIINAVPGINRVVYDITSKPPSTIELE